MANLKALTEKRAEKQAEMERLLKLAETENRAMSEEETAAFDACEQEIRAIDETVARAERARGIIHKPAPAAGGKEKTVEERAAEEERAFADYVMGKKLELRTGEQNMTMGNNGAIIPSTIANNHQGGQGPLPDSYRGDHLQRQGHPQGAGMGQGEHDPRHCGGLSDRIHRNYRRRGRFYLG